MAEAERFDESDEQAQRGGASQPNEPHDSAHDDVHSGNGSADGTDALNDLENLDFEHEFDDVFADLEQEFEHEFEQLDERNAQRDETAADGVNFDADALNELTDAATGMDDVNNGNDVDVDDVIESLGEASFDDELQGILGNRAKVALLITQLASAQLLAAFCALADMPAVCVDSPIGAIAILKNLDGESPEVAAEDLTKIVDGMPAILALNRADKVEAAEYLQGAAQQKFPPPVLFIQTERAPFIEDLLLGMTSVRDVLATKPEHYDSSELNQQQAYEIIAKHLRPGTGIQPMDD